MNEIGSLNGLDVALLTIVGLSAVIGLFRGLVREVLSLVAWVLAFVLAILFSAAGAEYVPAGWGSEGVRLMLAFAAIFLATLILSGIVQAVVARVISGTGLSGMDRLLGLLFGAGRGLLICVVLLMGLREVAGDQPWWLESALRDEFLGFEDEVRDLFGQGRALVRDLPPQAADMSI